MEAIEAGAGYRVEWEDTLYIVSTPLVRIDEQLRWHSEDGPAIRWKGGKEFYYLCGTNFNKKLWQKTTSGKLAAKDLAEISDVDQRKIAMTYLTGNDFVAETKAKLVDTGVTTYYEHLADRRVVKHLLDSGVAIGVQVVNRLYKIAAGDLYQEDKYFLKYTNPSTMQEHISFVTNFVKEVGEKADLCMARKHNCGTVKEFLNGGGA